MPLIAPREQSPDEFPPAAYVSADQLGEGISQALAARPEMAVLDFERRQVAVELQYARNLTLPKLDTFLEASQDVGQAASAKRDKSPFELEAGILAEVPLQRREGAGKIEIAEAKLRQIEAKRRFMRDKIVAEVQDAVSALNLAAQRVERTGDNVRLAQQARELGEQAFRAGDIDLIALNIYETAAADAELFRIQAYFDYFAALANFRAALGIDVYRLVASEP